MVMTPLVKKLDERSIIGQKGINLIERIVLNIGWVWHPTGALETGIDGIIEIRDPMTGQTTNSIIQVQSKATEHPFQAETKHSFEYLCQEKDLNYWLWGNAPVILVRCRPNTNEAYWIPIKTYFSTPEKRASRKIYFDKKQNCFDADCKSALIAMAVPKDSGIYFSPLPKKEVLYSNLLKVSYPERLYFADTDFNDPKAVWDEMRSHCKEIIIGAFVLHSKRMMSFCDLSAHPWDKICKIETLKREESKNWADSDDPEKRRNFAELLNRSLRDMIVAKKINLAFHKEKECFYFRPTRNLRTRRFNYQSVVNKTSRDVFRAYYSKHETRRLLYYRHSAFEGRFIRTDEGWYLEITPTYLFTSDGRNLAMFHEDNLKGIKLEEANAAVLGQVIMWAAVLRPPEDLFRPRYPYLEFTELQKFDVDSGIHDKVWLPQEEPEDQVELTSSEPGLFDK